MKTTVNTLTAWTLLVLDVDGVTPVTGLTNANFTKAVYANGAVSAVALTITEIGSGYYAASLTPTSTGRWYVTAKDTLDTIRGYYIDVDTAAVDLTALIADVALVRKTATNRLKLDFALQQLVLYDDDGVTAIKRWPLNANGGTVTPFTGAQSERAGSII